MKLRFHRIHSTSLVFTFINFYSFSLVAWLRVSQSCCMLSFDLLEILSLSFFWVFIVVPFSEKSSKIKFLEKFQKILYKFLYENGAERHLGGTRWGSHATSHTGGVAQPWPRHPCVRGPHQVTHLSLLPQLFLSPENNDTLSWNPSSCCSSPKIFDLLAQPNISAEIWIICSMVYDSSTCPSRFSFGEVFLEYFSIVGDSIKEYACLFYCLESLFWCMIAL
jgi:hypothetical protein